MAVDKISPTGDDRIQHKTANVNGKTYGYLFGEPAPGSYKATIFLIHGFPDISMGWRYQIPVLLEKGFRVVAPDCLGYASTDAPDDHTQYSHKLMAADIKELASQLGESKIIICGHDWGAALTYRTALWHPELVSHIITICVPYLPPSPMALPLEVIVENILPNFRYQLQFRDGEVEKQITTRDQIRQLLTCLFGGKTEDGKYGFVPTKGVLFENLMQLKPPPFVSTEEIEYHADQIARHGIHAPLNWYRTLEINQKDELAITDPKINVPVLFIQALKDLALPPQLAEGMENVIPQLTIEQVDTGHWPLVEDPEATNAIITRWLAEKV